MVDTAGWRTTQSYEVGVELKHSREYQRKHWEFKEDTLTAQVDFWRADGPKWNVRLTRMARLDSLRRLTPKRTPSASYCKLGTRSGLADAVVQRTTRSAGGDAWEPLFTVEAVLAMPDSSFVMFAGFAADSAGHAQQVAMARSLRILKTVSKKQ